MVERCVGAHEAQPAESDKSVAIEYHEGLGEPWARALEQHQLGVSEEPRRLSVRLPNVRAELLRAGGANGECGGIDGRAAARGRRRVCVIVT